jgi:hypothetical protein
LAGARRAAVPPPAGGTTGTAAAAGQPTGAAGLIADGTPGPGKQGAASGAAGASSSAFLALADLGRAFVPPTAGQTVSPTAAPAHTGSIGLNAAGVDQVFAADKGEPAPSFAGLYRAGGGESSGAALADDGSASLADDAFVGGHRPSGTVAVP